MPHILTWLFAFRKKIGWECCLFFTLAFVALAFAGQLTKDNDYRTLQRFVTGVAGCLFAVALLIALFRVSFVLFTKRPARGLIDGLAAGLIAGILGGFFGYGFHDYESDPAYLRIAICVIFTVPVAGVLGVLADFLHPDRPIAWRLYLGPVVLGAGLIIGATGFGIFLLAPEMTEGIMLTDIQLLFEVGLVVLVIIVTISFGWSIRKLFARLPMLLVSIALARAPTFIISLNDPDQEGVKLYMMRFLRDYDTTTAERLTDIHITWGVELATVVILLILWFLASYAIFYKNHYVSRWLDHRFGA